MSLKNFIAYLQQLLTMVDPRDAESIERAKAALNATVQFAVASHKVDGRTHRAMYEAIDQFDLLVQTASSFAGRPGAYVENEQKRRRLLNALYPGC